MGRRRGLIITNGSLQQNSNLISNLCSHKNLIIQSLTLLNPFQANFNQNIFLEVTLSNRYYLGKMIFLNVHSLRFLNFCELLSQGLTRFLLRPSTYSITCDMVDKSPFDS